VVDITEMPDVLLVNESVKYILGELSEQFESRDVTLAVLHILGGLVAGGRYECYMILCSVSGASS
jgi:predicted proteasome-type protease